MSAALCHELFDALEALTLGVADLRAEVTAAEWESAGLSATRAPCVAVHLLGLFSANAALGHGLKAGWAVPKVALEGAGVATRQRLLARSVASWRELAALDRGIGLRDATRAEERLSGVHPARLARAQMAEVVALVLSASERLVALLEADVVALRVSSARLDRAADLFALVPPA